MRLPLPGSGLWSNREFLKLWAAQAVSAFGSQITNVALPLAAILALHASAFQVAVLTALASIPYAIFSIPGGVWVDRIRRRSLMVAADVGRGLILLSIPAAYVSGALTLPQLYLVAFAHGTLTVAFALASQAYLPSLLPRSELVDANAKFEATAVVARGAGPAAAGGLVSLVGAPLAILGDAIALLASGAFIRSIKHREPGREPENSSIRSVRRELHEGARYILSSAYLKPLLAGNSLANFSLGLVWSIVIVFAVRTLGLGPALVGIVLSLGQIGGLLGAALGTRIANAIGVGPTVTVSTFLFGPALVVLAAAPSATPVPFLALGWAIESFARALYGVSAASVRQALVPDRLQGRVVGFMSALGVGAFPLGALVGGAVAASLGLRAAMFVGAAVSFGPFLPTLFSPVRRLALLSDLEEPSERAAGMADAG
jgi:MFS family permease